MNDVARARAGDTAAFGRLVRAHARGVNATTLSVTLDVARAEDAAQDAFVRAWERLPELGDPERFGAWVRQIARNRARDLVRADVRAVARGAAEAAPAEVSDPEAEHAAKQAAALLAEALAGLSEAEREAVLLTYRDELDSVEVAERTGATDAAVRQRLLRARRRLREHLLLLGALESSPRFVAGVLALCAPRRRPLAGWRWLLPLAGAPVLAWFLPPTGCGATRPLDAPPPPEVARRVPAIAPPTALPPPVAAPAGSAADEAWRALASAVGFVAAVRCPDLPLTGRPEVVGLWRTQVVDGVLYGVSKRVTGKGLLLPDAPDAEPVMLSWSPEGCSLAPAVEVPFFVRVDPPDPVTAVEGCFVDGEPDPAGFWPVVGFQGSACQLRAAGRGYGVSPVRGARMPMPRRDDPPLSDEQLAAEELQATQAAFARALATPELSPPAQALLEALREVELADAGPQ
jgi:RNA polymerase sigma factor (sigma-70 family)